MDKCKVCGGTDVDDYGCVDCFISIAIEEMYRLEEENDDA